MASPYHITADVEALTECLAHCPGFVAYILGPVPFGQPPGERIVLHINAIIVPSLEVAEEACWIHIRNACEVYSYEFDSDEWEIVSLTPVNQN